MPPRWQLACGAAFGATGEGPQRVGSLIVKLRDAPAHDKAATAARAAQRDRATRVFAEAGLMPTTLRPSGRAAQRIDLGRRVDGAELAAVLERVRARPDVEWVVPNARERRLQVPNDPLYPATATSSGQWWLFARRRQRRQRHRGPPPRRARRAGGVVEQHRRGRAVVAVLDTGITAHPDLAGRILPGYDFVSTIEYANDGDGWDADASDPGDGVSAADSSANPALFGDCEVDTSSWHGTSIAGIVAATANNGPGGAGVCWGGRVLPVRVAGKCGAELADIVDGMRWAAGLPVYDDQNRLVPMNPNPARIVNVSFGGSAACNAAYQDTIDELRGHGVLVVAAAGNEGGALTRPASLPRRARRGRR